MYLKRYNFLKSNELIPDSLNQLIEHQLNGYFKNLFSLFLKDNGDFIDLFYWIIKSDIISQLLS